MAKKKAFRIIVLTLSFLLLFFVAIFFLMKNLAYFDVKKVTVTHNEIVSDISQEAEAITNSLNNLNIFDFSKNELKKKLENTSCVESVKIRKFYPSEVFIQINYKDFTSRVVNEIGDKYFLCNELGLFEITDDVFRNYNSLKAVQLSSEYIESLQKWGLDQGFIQMLNLASYVNKNNLIISINYDNNKGNDFGRMNLTIPSLNVLLSIREPVTVSTLESAMEIIKATKPENLSKSYDLYASGLFGRS